MSIASLSICSGTLFFQEVLVGLCVQIQSILKSFLIGSGQEFSENFQILIGLNLWFFGNIPPNDGHLMKLAHLSGDISESSE